MTLASISATANPQQIQASTTTDGLRLSIADPGLGKTFTLVAVHIYAEREDDAPRRAHGRDCGLARRRGTALSAAPYLGASS